MTIGDKLLGTRVSDIFLDSAVLKGCYCCGKTYTSDQKKNVCKRTGIPITLILLCVTLLLLCISTSLVDSDYSVITLYFYVPRGF